MSDDLNLRVAEVLFRMDCGIYRPQSGTHSYFRTGLTDAGREPYLKLARHIIRMVRASPRPTPAQGAPRA